MVRATTPSYDWHAQDGMFDGGYDSSTPLPYHQDSGKAGFAREQRQRLRSLSSSFPWSRPKSSLALGMDSEYATNYTNDVIIEDELDGSEYNGGASNHGHPVSGLKSMVRRASKSIKGMVHRRPSAAADEALGSRSATMRPTTSHSLWTG